MKAKNILRCALVFTSALFASAGAIAAEADAIIARARAFLGSESALESVKSIRFTGTIAEGTETRGSIVITLKKPFQQRIERTIGDEREVTALDEFDGQGGCSVLDIENRVDLDHVERGYDAGFVEEFHEAVPFPVGEPAAHGRADAGGHLGVDDVRMACTPERVWRAIQDAKAGRGGDGGERAAEGTVAYGGDSTATTAGGGEA